MADIQHKDINDPERHEPKGASTASNGQILVANGSGGTSWSTPTFSTVKSGFWNYADTGTATTPVTLTNANTSYDISCDGIGTSTNLSYAYPGATNIWNVSTNRMDFTNLPFNTQVILRPVLSWTTTGANQEISASVQLGAGQPSPVTFSIDKRVIKTASTTTFSFTTIFYIGDSFARDNPGRILLRSDGAANTVRVLGIYFGVVADG